MITIITITSPLRSLSKITRETNHQLTLQMPKKQVESSKKAAGNARKAAAAASKADAENSRKAAEEAQEWEKGAKSNAKK